jgi:hypothetical protein
LILDKCRNVWSAGDLRAYVKEQKAQHDDCDDHPDPGDVPLVLRCHVDLLSLSMAKL